MLCPSFDAVCIKVLISKALKKHLENGSMVAKQLRPPWGIDGGWKGKNGSMVAKQLRPPWRY
jgi:hypothetical protein